MQQVKRTQAVRCPVCGRGRVIDAAASVDPGRLRLYGPEHADKAELFFQVSQVWLQIGIFFEKTIYLEYKNNVSTSSSAPTARISSGNHRVRSLTGSSSAVL